jgi:hypothetical protein
MFRIPTSQHFIRCALGWLVASTTCTATLAADRGYLYPADQGEGFHFSHHDWEIACDNTRTCRAAGYHSDNNTDMAVSVLLTREAGSSTPVKAQLMLGQYGDKPDLSALPAKFMLGLEIDGKTMGRLQMEKDSLTADLPQKMVTALLGAVTKNTTIEFAYGDMRWPLSGAGATATLLKMDEFQGRLGTPSALVRKGSKSESSVRPAVPVPKLVTPPLPKAQLGDESFTKRHANALLQALKASTPEDECADLFATEGDAPQLESVRLSNTQMLVSTRCWLAAYNFGYGHWLVNTQPPFKAKLVNTMANDGTANGTLSASHKGRGLGDCWSSDEWNWDGRKFVHTQSSTTGQCKLMAAGGAWQLPTIVTHVQTQN